MHNELQHILNLLEKEQATEARKVFNNIQNSNSIDYLLVKAKLEQKFQNWSKAINAYNLILEIDNNHKEAKDNLTHINDILNFSGSGRMNV